MREGGMDPEGRTKIKKTNHGGDVAIINFWSGSGGVPPESAWLSGTGETQGDGIMNGRA